MANEADAEDAEAIPDDAVIAVVFSITAALFPTDGTFPLALRLGHPKTEARHIYPLRPGQQVFFRLSAAGTFDAIIERAGEHLVELRDVAFRANSVMLRIPVDRGQLEEGEMLRLSTATWD